MIDHITPPSRDIPSPPLATKRLRVPVPVRREHSSGQVIAAAEWPYADEPGSRIIMSMSDKTIHVYDSESLTKVRQMESPIAGSLIHAICPLDGATIVSGGDGGCLAVSNLVTNCEPILIKAHRNSVASLDVWRGYIVSASRTGEIQVFRFAEGTLKLIGPHKKLRYVPLSVKLVSIAGHMRVLVAKPNSSFLDLYAVGSMTLEMTVNIFKDDVVVPSPFRLGAIALNEARTHYAGAIINVKYAWPRYMDDEMQLIIGSFGSRIVTKSLEVFTWNDWYLKPKLMWSLSGTHIYLSSSHVHCLLVCDGVTDVDIWPLGCHSFMQVCRGAEGRELLIAGQYNYFKGFVMKM